jgi:hypothetical protein
LAGRRGRKGYAEDAKEYQKKRKKEKGKRKKEKGNFNKKLPISASNGNY